MPTNRTKTWRALQLQLRTASKNLGAARKAYGRAQANAQTLVSGAEKSLGSAIEAVQTVLDKIASTPPGTYPNNIDHPPG